MLVILIPNINQAVAAESIVIKNAWLRQSPPTITHLAGYLEIVNASPHEQTLIAAKSDAFEYIEFHNSEIKQDVIRMRRHANITIPANTTFIFKPGGYHLMLLNKRSTMPIGTNILIKLIFQNANSYHFTATVKRQYGNNITTYKH